MPKERTCPNMKCSDFAQNMKKINGAFTISAVHGLGGYSGKQIDFCPWCGSYLVELSKQEPKVREIKSGDKVYAILTGDDELPNTTVWYGAKHEPLQASKMLYNKGKIFRTHRHKLNPRTIHHTQECFVVIKGRIQVDIYTDNPFPHAIPLNTNTNKDFYGQKSFSLDQPKLTLGTLIAGPGQAIFIYHGFHRLSILEDKTLAYEIKAGQFTSIDDDKEF